MAQLEAPLTCVDHRTCNFEQQRQLRPRKWQFFVQIIPFGIARHVPRIRIQAGFHRSKWDSLELGFPLRLPGNPGFLKQRRLSNLANVRTQI